MGVANDSLGGVGRPEGVDWIWRGGRSPLPLGTARILGEGGMARPSLGVRDMELLREPDPGMGGLNRGAGELESMVGGEEDEREGAIERPREGRELEVWGLAGT